MNIKQKYVELIAAGIRYAISETNIKWPDDTIILTPHYHELSKIDEILGMKIYVMNIHCSCNFTVSFPARFEKEYLLLNKFLEYTDLYNI